MTFRLEPHALVIDDKPFPVRAPQRYEEIFGSRLSWYRKAALLFENRWAITVFWSSASYCTPVEVDDDFEAADVEIAVHAPDDESIGPHVVWGHVDAETFREAMDEVMTWPSDLDPNDAYGRVRTILGDQEEG